MRKGRIHIYTGSGKGKTTAALGLALRAAGAGMRVFIAQFIKKRICGEHLALMRFAGEITVKQYGAGFLRRRAATAAEIAAAKEALAEIRAVIASGSYQVVILDEVFAAVSNKLISTEELLVILAEKPDETEIVLTGRDAGDEIVARADLVTEMREVKHYFRQGVKARRGIEF